MSEETRRLKDIVTTIESGRANLSTDQTFVLSAEDTSTGAVKGTNITGNGAELRVHTVKAIVNQSTGDVTYPSHRFGNASINELTIASGIDDGIHRNGFNGNIYDVLAKSDFVFDNITKVATFSFTDETDVDVTVNNKRILIPDGSDLLSADPIDETYTGWYQYYFDSNGQLSAIKGGLIIPSFFFASCLVTSLYHSQANKGIPSSLNYPGAEISMIWQTHGAGSIDWRAPHHQTERSKISLYSAETTTTSTTLVPTSVLSVSTGRVLDEDIDTAIIAVDGVTGVWPVYYHNDVVDNIPLAHRGEKTLVNLQQPYVTSLEAGIVGGDSNVIWSDITYTDELITGAVTTRVDDNHFVLAHILVGCGILASGIVFTGQNEYSSLENARDNVYHDLDSAYFGDEILHEAVHVSAVILDHLGNIMPINDDGLMIIDIREFVIKQTLGSSGDLLVADGAGAHIATKSPSISNLEISDVLKILSFAGRTGNVLITGPDGTISSTKIFGTGTGAGEYDADEISGSITITNGNETDTDSIGLSHTMSADLASGIISYSINTEVYSGSDGVIVEIYKDAVLFDEALFVGEWGTSVILSKSITIGVTAISTVFEIKLCAFKKFQTVIVNSGALNIIGAIVGSPSGAFFIEATNGYGEGLHTFEGVKTTGQVIHESLPISASGLSIGQLWNDSGTVKVV